ncbi:MAG: hypothetical protein Q9216_006614, partial [Gyalolechia sp. 2 TL-2023]
MAYSTPNGFIAAQEKVAELGELQANDDSKFDDVGGKVEAAESNLDGRLNEVDRQFSRAISQNVFCAQGWQQDKPMGKLDAYSNHPMPPKFLKR